VINDFYRGDTQVYTLTIKDKDGNPIDLTGSTIFFTMKENLTLPDDSAALQVIVKTHTDPTNGITKITVPATDTSNLKGGYTYFYDFQLVDANSNVKTLLAGKVKVLPDVTQSIQ